jgi:large subunit ribosomal protein L34
MPKRTYHPQKGKRQKKHGFRQRQRTRSGRAVIKRRILKKRQKITV